LSKHKILIVDGHPITRKGLQAVFGPETEFEIVGEAENGQEAVEKALELCPDVVLMDLRTPEIDGATACRQIKLRAPQINVVVFTTACDDENIFEAIEVGAAGFLLKDVAPDELVRAIRLVCQGRFFLHPPVSKNVLQRFSALSKFKKEHGASFGLTSREVEVLRLMAGGRKNKEIARELWVSEGTVKTHVSNILRKLNQKDRAQAVIVAFHLGLVKMTELREAEDESPPCTSQ
jgi:DNA-binding NarL/FixJ family response regulator